MTKRYSILQKKLQELESILYELLSLPPETLVDQQLYAQDIDQRFKFVRKLLSAEIASHPRKPYHLQQIACRLTELQTVYQEWDSLKALTVLDSLEPPVSTCSCTETCLNDDGEEGDSDVSPEVGSPGFEEAEKFYQGLLEQENVHAIEEKDIGADDVQATDTDAAAEQKQKTGWVVCKYFGAIAAGIVVGMASMGLFVARFSFCFHCVEHNNFLLTPT